MTSIRPGLAPGAAQGRGADQAAPPQQSAREERSGRRRGSAFTPEPGRPPVPGFRSIPRTRATGRSPPGRSSPPMCPVDNHQDRPTDDQAERRRYGTVAAARADVTFCSAPACRLTIRIRPIWAPRSLAWLWLPKTPYRQVIRVLPTCSKASRWSMIATRVPALRVPSRRPDTRVAAAVQASAGVEGRRDPSAAPPAGGPAATDGGTAEADVDRPGAVRRTAHAHPSLTPRRAALVHHPWHDPALAPRYRPPPLGRQIQTEEARATTDPPPRRPPGVAHGGRQRALGATGGSPASWPGSASPSHPRRSGRS